MLLVHCRACTAAGRAGHGDRIPVVSRTSAVNPEGPRATGGRRRARGRCTTRAAFVGTPLHSSRADHSTDGLDICLFAVIAGIYQPEFLPGTSEWESNRTDPRYPINCATSTEFGSLI